MGKNYYCPHCKATLTSWSKFKDLKKKEGVGLAICGFILNGMDHFWAGESRSAKQKADFRTLELYYCNSCGKYFMVCEGCRHCIELSEMPNETRTMCTCPKCHKTNLYASTDYQLGG